MDQSLSCPDCKTDYATTDNYCRNCGMYVAALRTTAVTTMETRALDVVRPGLRAPVRRAATAMAIGAALQIGLGLASRYVAAQAAQKAARGALSVPAKGRGRGVSRREPIEDDTAIVSETLLVRRLWIRR